jgi:hypothetical protein
VRTYDGRRAQLRRSVRTVGCFTDGHGRAAPAAHASLTSASPAGLVAASAITLVGPGCGDERRAYAVWGRFEGEHVGKSAGLLDHAGAVEGLGAATASGLRVGASRYRRNREPKWSA